jgi:hypothetical protein
LISGNPWQCQSDSKPTKLKAKGEGWRVNARHHHRGSSVKARRPRPRRRAFAFPVSGFLSWLIDLWSPGEPKKKAGKSWITTHVWERKQFYLYSDK